MDAFIGLRKEQGSCNNCQQRESISVIVVQLGTMQFRVCNKCAMELLEKIGFHTPQPQKGHTEP